MVSDVNLHPYIEDWTSVEAGFLECDSNPPPVIEVGMRNRV